MRPAPLDRKVLRDLWRMKWQVLAIALLIACGVSVAVMAFAAQQALSSARDRFYADTCFADAFIELKRAPLSLAREISAVPGVTFADARISRLGLMPVLGLVRPATVRLVSLPQDEGGGLDGLQVTRGRMPDPGRTDEAVALQGFLDAAHIELGDTLTAIVGGRASRFRIVGAALSPEYIYVPSPESFMPDDAHQAVLWAPRAAVERASGMTGAFNSVAVRVAAETPVKSVLSDLDRMLAPYGGRAAYARADQPSHAFLEAELKELATSATILPPVFLLVAAALVHMVTVRLVEAEREQIGLLKAFGYGDFEAATPYLRLSTAIGLVGVAAGGLVGLSFGAAMVDLYRAYFRFPILRTEFPWATFLLASGLALAAAVGGSLLAIRRAVAVSPAIAMQPPRPPAYRAGLLDGLLHRAGLDQATRTIVRQLERFPARTMLSTVGLASSLALLVGTQFLFDSIEQVLDHTYYRTQRWSDSLSLDEAKPPVAIQAIRRLPGVFAAEPARVVAARLSAEGREETLRIIGLDSDARLRRPLDAADRPVSVEGGGLVISETLAGRLRVRPGGVIWVEALEGRGTQAALPVTGLTRDYSGFTAYMSRRALNRLVGEGDLANAANLLVQPDRRPAFYSAVARVPQIVGASSRDETVASWRRTMTEAFRTTILFYVSFAAAIAFGVAYNTSRIALSERGRDLATLHVLGFGHWECAYILASELLVLALAATPLGLLAGRALAEGLVAAYSRNDLRLPAVISARSYGVAMVAYGTAVALGGALVLRRIWTLDLVSVLKTRE